MMHMLIDRYLAGPGQLRAAIAGMSQSDVDTAPVAGKWSTRQVICHIADFELVYADRMKRVIAENEPTMFAGDPDVFAARLAYANRDRDIEEELQLIAIVRAHVARILKTLKPQDFQRQGIHSEAGPITLEQLLISVTDHVPHHIRFIDEKRAALSC